MTVLVGLEHGGRVWLGSDSFSGTDTSRDLHPGPKWFRVGGAAVVGFAGAYRPAEVLRHHVKVRPPRPGEDPHAYLVTELVAAFRVQCRARGVSTRDAEFLVAFRGHLYRLQNDFSVVPTARGFDAIGAGEDYALGALAALTPTERPGRTIRRALTAAAHVCPQVSAPFYVQAFGPRAA